MTNPTNSNSNSGPAGPIVFVLVLAAAFMVAWACTGFYVPGQ